MRMSQIVEMTITPGPDTSKDEINAYNVQIIGDFSGLVKRTAEQKAETVQLREEYIQNLKELERK